MTLSQPAKLHIVFDEARLETWACWEVVGGMAGGVLALTALLLLVLLRYREFHQDLAYFLCWRKPLKSLMALIPAATALADSTLNGLGGANNRMLAFIGVVDRAVLAGQGTIACGSDVRIAIMSDEGIPGMLHHKALPSEQARQSAPGYPHLDPSEVRGRRAREAQVDVQALVRAPACAIPAPVIPTSAGLADHTSYCRSSHM